MAFRNRLNSTFDRKKALLDMVLTGHHQDFSATENDLITFEADLPNSGIKVIANSPLYREAFAIEFNSYWEKAIKEYKPTELELIRGETAPPQKPKIIKDQGNNSAFTIPLTNDLYHIAQAMGKLQEYAYNQLNPGKKMQLV